MILFAASVYAVLMAFVIVFQLCLTAGLPWGAASMGGKYRGKYPTKMRIVSFINAFVLVFLVLIVLAKAGFILTQFQPVSNIAIWFVVAFSVLGTIANAMTPSRIEKIIWTPVTFIQFIAGLSIALN